MLIKIKKVTGALSYLFQYTTDPQMAEGSWKPIYETRVKCLFTGLVSGTRYYFRVGAIGPRKQLLFSDVVNKVAY